MRNSRKGKPSGNNEASMHARWESASKQAGREASVKLSGLKAQWSHSSRRVMLILCKSCTLCSCFLLLRQNITSWIKSRNINVAAWMSSNLEILGDMRQKKFNEHIEGPTEIAPVHRLSLNWSDSFQCSSWRTHPTKFTLIRLQDIDQ